jgi:agmatinase
MKKNKLNFLGVGQGIENISRKRARCVISLIPFEKTTTYKKGTAAAPEAIVAASQHIEFYDEALGLDASRQTIITLRPSISDLSSISYHVSRLKSEYPDAIFGFLGGEHSITPAIIEGFREEELGIVWIDAHADLREEYMGSKFNHACAARNCLKLGKIVQVGVRSLAKEEHDFLENTDSVRRFREWSDEARRAILDLPSRTYLSVDVDGLDPSVVRAVGTPEPGGLGWSESLNIVDFVCREKNLLAFDVVELSPSKYDVASDFAAARLVYKIITYNALYHYGHTREDKSE